MGLLEISAFPKPSVHCLYAHIKTNKISQNQQGNQRMSFIILEDSLRFLFSGRHRPVFFDKPEKI
jgi:hypothetical protein